MYTYYYMNLMNILYSSCGCEKICRQIQKKAPAQWGVLFKGKVEGWGDGRGGPHQSKKQEPTSRNQDVRNSRQIQKNFLENYTSLWWIYLFIN